MNQGRLELRDRVLEKAAENIGMLNNISGSTIIIGGGYYNVVQPIHAAKAANITGLLRLYLASPNPHIRGFIGLYSDALYIPLPDYKLTAGSANRLAKLLKRGRIKVSSALIGLGLTPLPGVEGELASRLIKDYNVRVVFDSISSKGLELVKDFKTAIICLANEALNLLKNITGVDVKGLDEAVGHLRNLNNYKDVFFVVLEPTRITMLSRDMMETINICNRNRIGFKFFERPMFSGLIAGLLAKLDDYEGAALIAAYVYSKAVERAIGEYGISYTSDDMLSMLSIEYKALLSDALKKSGES